MLVLISAMANGGTLYKPHILKAAESVEGKIVYESSPQIIGRLPASKRTVSIIRRGLWKVVNGPRGTARVASVKGIEISGKTGTSQVVGHKEKDNGHKRDKSIRLKAHAWFVAYAKARGAHIAVSVIVEHGEHGSGTASPIAREIVKSFFPKRFAVCKPKSFKGIMYV